MNHPGADESEASCCEKMNRLQRSRRAKTICKGRRGRNVAQPFRGIERVGAARTPERDALRGTMSDGTVQRSNRSAADTATLLVLVQGRRPGWSRGGSGCVCGDGAARMRECDALLGTMSDGIAAPSAHPRPHAGPVAVPLRIGAVAELLPVPSAAADRAGAVPRPNRSAAETATLLALMRGRRPGRSRGGIGGGCRFFSSNSTSAPAILAVNGKLVSRPLFQRAVSVGPFPLAGASSRLPAADFTQISLAPALIEHLPVGRRSLPVFRAC